MSIFKRNPRARRRYEDTRQVNHGGADSLVAFLRDIMVMETAGSKQLMVSGWYYCSHLTPLTEDPLHISVREAAAPLGGCEFWVTDSHFERRLVVTITEERL